MYAGCWSKQEEEGEWTAVPITKRRNRSTQSAYGTKDEKKSQPNPVSSDSDDANLPHDKNTLKTIFTLRLIGDVGKPFACNDPGFEDEINKNVNEFKKDTRLEDLAHRYAYNIANGRFLWRNRVGAEEIIVKVEINGTSLTFDAYKFSFDAYKFSLDNFSTNEQSEDLRKLKDIIQGGLLGEDKFVCLEVVAYTKLGKGQHIFPSQEMNMNEKEKVLFQLGGCAAMHGVKIGNALRTIDTWYDSEWTSPIAVEPYGSVTQRGRAYRAQTNDLYTLMLGWVNGKNITDDDKNYVTANLIRGGVFSKSGKEG